MVWNISLGWVFGIVIFICCLGCLLGFKIEELGPDVIKMRDGFYYLYCTYERWLFLVFGILSFGFIALNHLPDCRAFLPWGDDPRRWAWILAWGSFFICLLGTFYVYGIVSVFIVYCFFRYTQGHGWGGRYFHPNFPALIFVAIGGWKLFSDRIGAKPAWNLMAFSLIIAVLVQLPGRSWQVRDFSGHWQRAVEKITRQDAEVVILDTTRIFYGLDLVRNDLFLDNEPLVFYRRYLTMDQIDKLKQAHDVKELQYEDFESLGLMEAAPPRSAAEETHFFNPRASTPWRG